MGGRPPLWFRRTGGVGSNHWTRSHNSSETSANLLSIFSIDLRGVVKRQPQSIPWICCHSIEVVSAMTETPRVGVRLVGLHAPMCPHFHVDHATVPLVCTYAGPTSEWLEERDVDRSLLA
ncbi:MAG TPA: DUF1826 domain-containing protein, partial [Gammaproteobacteria bacterium]|nr:DUF1826 domain-containing protein [Gammaproteobacteria bacterium]